MKNLIVNQVNIKDKKQNRYPRKRQPKVNSRQKGAGGEREVCSILSKITGSVVTRSLESVRAGGADITCLPNISVEVKRKKRIMPCDVRSFWTQAVNQAEKEEKKPVLFMREDRGEWQIVLALGDLITVEENNYLPVILDLDSFPIIYKRWSN